MSNKFFTFTSFNDYMLEYFEEDELSDVERELVEDCFYRRQKEIETLKEERMMLRKIAYAYRGLDCHSSNEAIEAITKKGWQAQLDYEKWCEKNGKDVGFPDWRELEKEGE